MIDAVEFFPPHPDHRLGQATKTNEFSGIIFNSKFYVADFGPLYRALNSSVLLPPPVPYANII